MAVYKDFNRSFSRNNNNQVDYLEDRENIKQAIRDIIFTSNREKDRFKKPLYGSRIRTFLFEKLNEFIAHEIRVEIETEIRNWEPRIKLQEVEVEPDFENLLYRVFIIYEILNLRLQDELSLELKLLK